MFLIAFALGLREIEREPDGRIAIVIGLALITAAMVPVYSLPGVGLARDHRRALDGWPSCSASVREGGMSGVRRGRARARCRSLIPAAIVLVVVGLTQLPKVIDFLRLGLRRQRHRHQQQAPLRRLAARDPRDLAERQLAARHPRLLALLALRRADRPRRRWCSASSGGSGGATTRSRPRSPPGSSSTSDQVHRGRRPLHPGQGGRGAGLGGDAARRHGAARAGRRLAEADLRRRLHRAGRRTRRSSPCATRSWRRHDRLQELAEFQSTVAGQKVLALTSDRFTDYGLRTRRGLQPRLQLRDPGPSAGAKSQRLPIDFDSVPVDVLNQFPYAVTTSASTRARRRRAGPWPHRRLLPALEADRDHARRSRSSTRRRGPGRVFAATGRSSGALQRAGGEARHLAAAHGDRQEALLEGRAAGGALAEGGVAPPSAPRSTTTSRRARPRARRSSCRPGVGALAPVREPGDRDRRCGRPGLDAHLPAGMDAAIPYRPDQGPYWPVGRGDEQGRPDHRQRPGRRRQLVPVAARRRRPGGDREPDRRQPRRLQAGADGRRVRPLRRPHHRRSSSSPRPSRAPGPVKPDSRKATRNPAGSSPLPTLAPMKVGIVGLGYVGLPLAVAFAEAGHEVVGLDADPRKVEALAEGRSYIEDVPSERLAALDGPLHRDQPLRGPELLRRGDHLRPDAAHQLARARPHLPGRRRHLARGRAAEGPARRARVDHLPGHDPRAAACRSSRSPASRPGATSTSPSRPSGSTPAAPTTRSGPRRSSSAA